MDAQLASNSPQKWDSGGLEANKYLIFPVLDAAGFQNWRTNYSFFSVLFADLTSAGSWQALGWRTIDASLAVLFARAIAAGPGLANNRRVFGCSVRLRANYGKYCFNGDNIWQLSQRPVFHISKEELPDLFADQPSVQLLVRSLIGNDQTIAEKETISFIIGNLCKRSLAVAV